MPVLGTGVCVPVLGITVTELMLFGFGNGKDLKGWFLGS